MIGWDISFFGSCLLFEISEFYAKEAFLTASCSYKIFHRAIEKDELESNLDWTSRNVAAEERSLYVGDGRYGYKYQISVFAINAGGTSVPSECVYLYIPPDVPSPAPVFQASAQGMIQQFSLTTFSLMLISL